MENSFEKGLSISYDQEYVGVRTLKVKYTAEIIHNQLHEHKTFSSYDSYILENKINEYVAKLKIKYKSFLEKRKIEEEKQTVQNNIIKAQELTKEAIAYNDSVKNILKHTLNINDAVDWDKLYDKTEFLESNPNKFLKHEISKIEVPIEPKLNEKRPAPIYNDFAPRYNIFDHIIPILKNNKKIKADENFDIAFENWESECNKFEKLNNDLIDNFNESKLFYNKKVEEVINRVAEKEKLWLKRKEEFYSSRDFSNSKVDELKKLYQNGDEGAIEEYFEIVLNNSVYPEAFPQTFVLNYTSTTKLLLVNYDLPPIDKLSNVKEIKFISNEFKDYYYNDSQMESLFDLTMYNICIRTIHELFEADTNNFLDFVCFNGWVNSMDKSKGHRVNSCIMSIQVNKQEFEKINLQNIDVKVCFKSLKGIGSSKLSGINPIQPIIQLNKDDKRIIDHYNVIDEIDHSTNLAAMDWEDFENLIREVFEREFQSTGGEVKVTQASRDGGVDAIAFDPDPIRGGKIVIQAKRYTNTVGVSAVRDLYGTVSHEGATKGILVTTADYGPDAYDFIKGKPITLLNGANLLYLLEKHGYNAKIDINEAKNILNK
ncbi:MAG: restriction endonuclease [Chitinophagia bacterium]